MTYTGEEYNKNVLLDTTGGQTSVVVFRSYSELLLENWLWLTCSNCKEGQVCNNQEETDYVMIVNEQLYTISTVPSDVISMGPVRIVM